MALSCMRQQLLQRQQPSSGCRPARCTACPARCNVPAAAAEPPSRRRQSGAEPGAVSRGQLLKGGMLAAGGMLLGAAAPVQAEIEAAEAVQPALAAPVPVASAAAAQSFSKVLMKTLSDCELAVSMFPTFSYNAAGGGGTGTVREGADGLLHLTFDISSLNIPPINAQNAAIIGIPVPPPLNIAIIPQKLEGTFDPATGRIDLDFLASFEFTAGPVYKAAPLTVSTTLTTEASQGVLRSGSGERMRADGRARLVGVARVPRTDDFLVNTFLRLPTDALAVLSAELQFS